MSRTNVPQGVKGAPALALRAVFAGIGQALFLSDRVRRRLSRPDDGQNAALGRVKIPVTQPGAADSPVGVPTRHAPTHMPAVPAAPAQPPAAAPPAGRPAVPAPPTRPPASASAGRPAAPPAAPPTGQATPAPPPASDLPIPNYDELSIASLRARLRGLDIAQLRRLLSYEKSRTGRSDVVTMYERRIAKLRQTGG